MKKENKKVEFNGIEYQVLNQTIFDGITYFLIYDNNTDNYKIIYEYNSELFLVLNNKNYKKIFDQLIDFE